jgi:hypothetical protein
VPGRQPLVTSPTTRPFPPEHLADLLADVVYEITDHRNLLPEIKRERSYAREQKQHGRRFPRQKTEYRQPLPPQTKIIFWLLKARST